MSNPSVGSDGLDEFIRYHHNPIVSQKDEEIARLQKLVEERGKEYCLSCVGNAEEMARLRKVVEEQKGELEAEIKTSGALIDSLRYAESQLAEQKAENERLKADWLAVHEELRMRSVELAEKEKVIKLYRAINSKPATQVELEKIIDNQREQLAEQTERVKELEHRVEVCQKFHGQALNPENLGEGK